ncbi:MAG TPA: hypothetical protein VGG52_02530 [Chthoniobacterales bacterium]
MAVRAAGFQPAIFVIAAAMLLCQTTAFAGARHFTFIYEAPTSPPGSFEIENYATTRFNDGFTGADFRHELEIGITERFQASIYFANWNYTRRGADGGFHYDTASIEVIHNLTNPVTDPIGISLYREISGGRRAFESETKLIAQKNFGPLILVYNLTLEAEWKDESLREHNGEIQQAFGASYELRPRVSAGAEMLHEVLLPAWHSSEAENNFFIGPNVSYRGNRWFATITALAQTTRTDGEPDYQVRLIFGVSL